MDNSQGVMIAFLPTNSDWCKIDLPHMTLVYAGEKDKLSVADFNSLAKDAASVAQLMRPFALRVTVQDIFGGGLESQVRVLRLRPTPELWSARRFVEQWDKSQHDFNPHCTVGPAEVVLSDPPGVIGFDKIMVAYGDENITFSMNTQY